MHWGFGIIQQVEFEKSFHWIYDQLPVDSEELFIDTRSFTAQTFTNVQQFITSVWAATSREFRREDSFEFKVNFFIGLAVDAFGLSST